MSELTEDMRQVVKHNVRFLLSDNSKEGLRTLLRKTTSQRERTLMSLLLQLVERRRQPGEQLAARKKEFAQCLPVRFGFTAETGEMRFCYFPHIPTTADKFSTLCGEFIVTAQLSRALRNNTFDQFPTSDRRLYAPSYSGRHNTGLKTAYLVDSFEERGTDPHCPASTRALMTIKYTIFHYNRAVNRCGKGVPRGHEPVPPLSSMRVAGSRRL